MKREDDQFEWIPIHSIARLIVNYLRYAPKHIAKLRIVRSLIHTFFSQGLIVKSSLGAKLSLNYKDYIAWSILSTGAYEPKSIQLASSLLKDGGVFIDIGANFGLWTCALGALPNVHCISIEPFAFNFLELQKNLALNQSVNFKLFNLALAQSEMLLNMECINIANLGMARVVLSDSDLSTSCLSHTVSATTLQSLIEFSDIKEITLMKIDVEGYELPILNGMDWSSNLRPRNIIIEFTDYSSRAQGNGKKSVLDFFTNYGYEGMTIDGQELNLEASILEDNAYFRDTAH